MTRQRFRHTGEAPFLEIWCTTGRCLQCHGLPYYQMFVVSACMCEASEYLRCGNRHKVVTFHVRNASSYAVTMSRSTEAGSESYDPMDGGFNSPPSPPQPPFLFVICLFLVQF